jgi:hypothetical protein
MARVALVVSFVCGLMGVCGTFAFLALFNNPSAAFDPSYTDRIIGTGLFGPGLLLVSFVLFIFARSMRNGAKRRQQQELEERRHQELLAATREQVQYPPK